MQAAATKTETKNIKPTLHKTENKPSIRRKTYIEVMRIIAAFLVIVNHTNSDVFLKKCDPLSFTWFFSLTYFFICKVAVPVFFMITGGLLLQKVDNPKKSFDRVLRICVVALIFSIAYYIKANRFAPNNMDVLEFIKTLFTSRATNSFWYIYAYIGLMILLPVLQRMAQVFSKNATRYFIFLSMGVMGLIPIIKIFFGITPHHYITDMFFAPSLGIVFMGYYIEKYMKIDKKTFAFSGVGFVLLIAFQVICTCFLYQKNPAYYIKLDNWQYLTITLSAMCFYIVFKYLSTVVKTKETVAKALCYFGSLTFGLYLLSDMVISMTRPLYANLQQEAPLMVATVLWEIIIFVLCGAVTAVLKLIPGLKKLL